MIRRPPRSTLFPTRRSSDLDDLGIGEPVEFRANPCLPARASVRRLPIDQLHQPFRQIGRRDEDLPERDRKSTRLNSSHSQISYAVFCLNKKKTSSTSPPSTT